jgi:hypothetical protein
MSILWFLPIIMGAKPPFKPPMKYQPTGYADRLCIATTVPTYRPVGSGPSGPGRGPFDFGVLRKLGDLF